MGVHAEEATFTF